MTAEKKKTLSDQEAIELLKLGALEGVPRAEIGDALAEQFPAAVVSEDGGERQWDGDHLERNAAVVAAVVHFNPPKTKRKGSGGVR